MSKFKLTNLSKHDSAEAILKETQSDTDTVFLYAGDSEDNKKNLYGAPASTKTKSAQSARALAALGIPTLPLALQFSKIEADKDDRFKNIPAIAVDSMEKLWLAAGFNKNFVVTGATNEARGKEWDPKNKNPILVEWYLQEIEKLRRQGEALAADEEVPFPADLNPRFVAAYHEARSLDVRENIEQWAAVPETKNPNEASIQEKAGLKAKYQAILVEQNEARTKRNALADKLIKYSLRLLTPFVRLWQWHKDRQDKLLTLKMTPAHFEEVHQHSKILLALAPKAADRKILDKRAEKPKKLRPDSDAPAHEEQDYIFEKNAAARFKKFESMTAANRNKLFTAKERDSLDASKVKSIAMAPRLAPKGTMH